MGSRKGARVTKRPPLQKKSGGAWTVDNDDPRGPLPAPLVFLRLLLPLRERLNFTGHPHQRGRDRVTDAHCRALVVGSTAQRVGSPSKRFGCVYDKNCAGPPSEVKPFSVAAVLV